MATLTSQSNVNVPRLDGLGVYDISGDLSATGNITAVGNITGDNIVGNASVSSPYISGTSMVSNGIDVTGTIECTTLIQTTGFAARSASGTQSYTSISTASPNTVVFQTSDYTQGTLNLTYSSGDFTNNSGENMTYLVTAFVGFAATAASLTHHAWIKYGTAGSPTNNIGWNAIHTSHSGSGVFVNPSAVINLAAGEVFRVVCAPGAACNSGGASNNRITICRI